MLNPHSAWRVEFARSLAEKIRPFRGVRAIVVAGSVARNYADAYSDIEIPIFWDSLPDDTLRLAIVNQLNASFLYGYDGPAAEDQLLINGVQVDLWHVSVAYENEIIQAVLRADKTDLSSLNAMDTARSCIPIYGHGIVEKWRNEAQAYPVDLAKRIIQEHIASFRIAELSVLAARDNPTAFYGHLSDLYREMFLVLMALNRRYFPTYKWMNQVLSEITIKPAKIDQQLRQAFSLLPAEATGETRRLLVEILGLVEAHFPSVDTVQAHKQLRYTRSAHQGPVTLE